MEGCNVGDTVGTIDGRIEGDDVGRAEGLFVTATVGASVVGSLVRFSVGLLVGGAVSGVGAADGIPPSEVKPRLNSTERTLRNLSLWLRQLRNSRCPPVDTLYPLAIMSVTVSGGTACSEMTVIRCVTCTSKDKNPGPKISSASKSYCRDVSTRMHSVSL